MQKNFPVTPEVMGNNFNVLYNIHTLYFKINLDFYLVSGYIIPIFVMLRSHLKNYRSSGLHFKYLQVSVIASCFSAKAETCSTQ